ncbi:hypothetical protein C0991_002139 [Blastosporella zonata]|nr:hypothetical protein C0991_002139 [Blastosporella zonata]
MDDTLLQMAYVEQQRLDGYSEAVAHAFKRKAAFDRRVLDKGPGEVIFIEGDLVQVYRSDLDYTFKMERKLLPKWSKPYRVALQDSNSYTLEMCGGEPIKGRFSARRLQAFEPGEGRQLAKEQKTVVAKRQAEEANQCQRTLGWLEESKQADRESLGDEDAAT